MAFWSRFYRELANFRSPAPSSPGYQRAMDAARHEMVRRQLQQRNIVDPQVLEVMSRVPRELFVPPEWQNRAYEDRPLSIGEGQTISQPYIVALMTQLARPTPTSRALEVGLGSGYQTAILAELCGEVFGIEILESLAASARERLESLGYRNISVRCGDGYSGWPEHAPFDIVLVTAAPDHVPPNLLEQLARGGRLIIPVGHVLQQLLLIEKQPEGDLKHTYISQVQFVPMTGEGTTASHTE